MNTPLVLLYAFAALAIAAGVIAVLAWRGWRKRRDGIDGPPSAPPSDWHDVTQRYRESRIEALREWMGEDHELVQQLPARDGRASRPADLPKPPVDATNPPAGPRESQVRTRSLHAAGTSPLVGSPDRPASRPIDSRPMQSRQFATRPLATRRGLYDRFA